ncbi:FMN-dependent dehydrogenase-domain-containing protein [Hypoxylon cercidicola]|nr:FMN-dependent dehydrogenase-domain-containing protein [Hypoxylon cercidicola]
MSDPTNPNISQRSTPPNGDSTRELFWGPNEGKHPPLNTNPAFQDPPREAKLDPQDAEDKFRVSAEWIDKHIWPGRSFAWDRIPWLVENWKRLSGGRPFCIKGIQSVEDTREAVQMGVDGIVVSNHAGRQVDGVIASLDALRKIADAVEDKIYALALGARFVFIGRLWVYALGSGGEEGVRHVVKGLLAISISWIVTQMNIAGYPSLEGINRDALDSMPKGAYFPSTSEMA